MAFGNISTLKSDQDRWKQMGGPTLKGTMPTVTGLTSKVYGGLLKQVVLKFDAVSLSWVDQGAAGGQVSQLLYTTEVGNILILGATSNLSCTFGSGIQASSTSLIGSVGTAAAGTGNATLTSTEADWGDSTSLGTLSSGVGILRIKALGAGNSPAGFPLLAADGNSAGIAAYLNFAASATNSTGNTTLTLTGALTLTYINLNSTAQS